MKDKTLEFLEEISECIQGISNGLAIIEKTAKKRGAKDMSIEALLCALFIHMRDAQAHFYKQGGTDEHMKDIKDFSYTLHLELDRADMQADEK